MSIYTLIDGTSNRRALRAVTQEQAGEDAC